jgi:hypothetical protein
MRRRSFVLGVSLSLLVGCAGASPATANRPPPGPMPAGANWRGVYQGPYHIALNVWTQGNRASGNWRAVGDREGQFFGTVFGNLLVLNWTERAVGNAETWSGRGYFVYSVEEAGKPHQIYGEWSMGRNGRSSPWWAVKRAEDPQGKQVQPIIDSDADEQYRDDGPGCEMGNCDTQDTETQ